MTTRRRALAVLAAGALIAPLTATGTALAQQAPGDAIPPQQQDITAFCENVLQIDPFVDTATEPFKRAIDCLYEAGITQGGPNGLPADQYGPTLNVQRDAMASFIARMVDTANALSLGGVRPLPAYDGTPAFTDVPPTDVHFTSIHRLEQAGIVQGGVAGKPGTEYSPKLLVTRAQMASFLARAYDFMTGAPLRTENDYYADDEDQQAHEANINGITSVGIAVGDGRRSYNPRDGVKRGQMAAFLMRLGARLEAEGRIAGIPPNSEALREAVTLEGGVEHLEAFQAIADANEDTRASGTDGYQESVDYVVDQLTAAGYEPEVQAFDFDFFQELAPAELTDSEAATQLATATYTYSGSTDDLATPAEETVSGNVVPVDIQEPPGEDNTSTSGCEAEDFEGFPTGSIALVQRGTCTFEDKATNAENAGAIGVIIYNEGQEGRTELFAGTLGRSGHTVPVVGLSYQDAQRFFDGGEAEIYTRTLSEVRETYNVIAQTATGNPDNVVMLGAHLDSVIEGPGINDNGTGTAGILEVALALAAGEEETTNAVRFAFWGAEELGLLGAEHYVAELPQAERDKIALYLNFDMIGSPNFARFVYDGDDSAEVGAGPGPQGSAAIEYMFADYYQSLGLPTAPTDFSGRSDYGPFIAEGVDIPAGGLFTGAEGVKTEAEEEAFGGEAGVAYDPCYHIACDTIENVNTTAFDQNMDAIAHAVAVFGASTTGAYDLSTPERTSGPGTEAGDPSSQGGLREGHAEHIRQHSS